MAYCLRLISEYVHQTAPQKVGEVLVNLGLTSLNEFQQLMEDLFKDKRVP